MSTVEVVFVVLGCLCLCGICGVCGAGMRSSSPRSNKLDHLHPQRPGKGNPPSALELPTATALGVAPSAGLYRVHPNMVNPMVPRDHRSKSPARNLEVARKP
jgi:hypothetical protein